jgi:DNA-binding NarL/FixJ family response regulator
MVQKIKVAVLDDHQSIIDGYQYRLSRNPNIEVVATSNYGEELPALLSRQKVDVLILDISVPSGPGNPNPYPVLNTIPKLINKYPEMNILVISMHNQPGIIRAVLETGSKGYILKDDRATISKLGDVIEQISRGNPYLSQQAQDILEDPFPVGSRLSIRQLEALSVCASQPGATTVQLADILGIAPSTMRNLLSGVYQNLRVPNRSAAIAKARQMGLITPEDPGAESR